MWRIFLWLPPNNDKKTDPAQRWAHFYTGTKKHRSALKYSTIRKSMIWTDGKESGTILQKTTLTARRGSKRTPLPQPSFQSAFFQHTNFYTFSFPFQWFLFTFVCVHKHTHTHEHSLSFALKPIHFYVIHFYFVCSCAILCIKHGAVAVCVVFFFRSAWKCSCKGSSKNRTILFF